MALEVVDIDGVAGTVRTSKDNSRRADVLSLPRLTGTAIAH